MLSAIPCGRVKTYLRVEALQAAVLSGCQSSFASSSGDALLEYEETTCSSGSRAGEATGVIVHGLLGSGRNWRNFSRSLANDLANATGRPWRFWLVDQRCHGHSLGVRGLPEPSTVSAAAADLGRLFDAKLASADVAAVIGHSLGGKVVMDLLSQRRKNPPGRQVWVLDSVVGAATPEEGEPSDVKRVLAEVGKIQVPVPSRDWLYQHLESRGFGSAFRLWMGSNLTPRRGGYKWTFAVECAQQLYESYQASEYWDLVGDVPRDVTLSLVRAARSDRWSERQWNRLKEAEAASEGRLQLHVLPDAGHWLHADNPEGLRQMLAAGMAASASE